MTIINELAAAVNRRRQLQATDFFPFPYLILQPRVPDPKEFKVIMHDGICKYFHQRGENSYYSPRPTSPSYEEVMSYVKKVYYELQNRSHSIILSGLVRIDIMRVKSSKVNKLVVNEIEGVDSNYSATRNEQQGMTQYFLKQHWANVINDKLCNMF
jgi:hypothetical protein